METVVNSTDFVRMCGGYAAFLFALGGVGITVLTLLLTLRQADSRSSYFPGLVSGVIVFVLACFVGAHLCTEGSTLVDYKGFKATELGQTYFVLAESNVFSAATLLVFVLVLLPLTYESSSTLLVRPLLFWLGGLFMACIVLWLAMTVVYLGQGWVLGASSVVTTFVVGWLAWASTKRRGYAWWPYLVATVACFTTELAVAWAAYDLHRVGLFDVALMTYCAAVSVGAIGGAGAAHVGSACLTTPESRA